MSINKVLTRNLIYFNVQFVWILFGSLNEIIFANDKAY